MVLQVRLADYTYTVLNNIMHCLEQKVGISAEISKDLAEISKAN